MKIKVLSWNIWKGKYLDNVIRFLKENDADIIGLQEVTEEDTTEGRRNLAKIIAKSLDYNYAYFKAFTTDRHEKVYDYGNAILTKHQIENPNYYFLSDLSDYKKDAETEPRIAGIAEININDKRVKIVNVHLAYSHELRSSKMRIKQIENLTKLINSNKTILMGDFNASNFSGEMNMVNEIVKNADQNSDKPTWSVFPTNYKGFEVKGLDYRIDHIFVSKDVKVMDFKVEESTASDHLPISATIEIE